MGLSLKKLLQPITKGGPPVSGWALTGPKVIGPVGLGGGGFALHVNENVALWPVDGKHQVRAGGQIPLDTFQWFFGFQNLVTQSLVRLYSVEGVIDDSGNDLSVVLQCGKVASADQLAPEPLVSVRWINSDLVNEHQVLTYEVHRHRCVAQIGKGFSQPDVRARARGTYELSVVVNRPYGFTARQLLVPAHLWDFRGARVGDESLEQTIDSVTLLIRRDLPVGIGLPSTVSDRG